MEYFFVLFYGQVKEKPSPCMEKVAIQKELTVEVWLPWFLTRTW